jgi:hypothetical protein
MEVNAAGKVPLRLTVEEAPDAPEAPPSPVRRRDTWSIHVVRVALAVMSRRWPPPTSKRVERTRLQELEAHRLTLAADDLRYPPSNHCYVAHTKRRPRSPH